MMIGPTPADARDVMLEGESGLLNIGPPDERPTYVPSNRLLKWPNGAIALVRSGHDPESLRGPQSEWAWFDELAAWQYPRDTFDMAMMGLRLGTNPQCVITTTPKPLTLLKELIVRSDVAVTTESTYANLDNLSPAFRRTVLEKYEGTNLGQQELHGQLLTESEDALWKREYIKHVQNHPDLVRVVVAIDPAGSRNKESSETGIIAVGKGVDGYGYVLSDVSGRYSPDSWARKAIGQYDILQADRIVAERNFGGDMVKSTLLTVDPNVSFKEVTASRGKYPRAEPIAALYEQGRIFHVGAHTELEDQLCVWEPDSNMASPDRLDALVWGLTELFPPHKGVPHVTTFGVTKADAGKLQPSPITFGSMK